jgi:hypothetical protein
MVARPSLIPIQDYSHRINNKGVQLLVLHEQIYYYSQPLLSKSTFFAHIYISHTRHLTNP